jgi:hypothetical protein
VQGPEDINMADESLEVAPLALQGASGVIEGHAAPLVSRSSGLGGSAETSGLAGVAVDRAVDGYCAAFAQRLSTVAAGLAGAAGAYSATEATNSQALASVAPVEAV